MGDYCVYRHTNLVNGKVYIGMTKDIAKRWHPASYKLCPRFAKAIAKYGWDRFHSKVMMSGLTKEAAQSREMDFISIYRAVDPDRCYNVSPGGECFMSGYKYSDEQRRRQSERQKGIGKGKHVSPDTEFKPGHGFSEETLRKMSEAKKGKEPWNKGLKGYGAGEKHPMKRPEIKERYTGANNYRARKIVQYDLDGNFIRVWDYASQPEKELGYGSSNIYQCCVGKTHSAYGYKWAYADNFSPEAKL